MASTALDAVADAVVGNALEAASRGLAAADEDAETAVVDGSANGSGTAGAEGPESTDTAEAGDIGRENSAEIPDPTADAATAGAVEGPEAEDAPEVGGGEAEAEDDGGAEGLVEGAEDPETAGGAGDEGGAPAG